MSGPFKLKYKNSAFPFKSPLKTPDHGEAEFETDEEHDTFHEWEKESEKIGKEHDIAAHVQEGTTESQELRRKQMEKTT